MESLKQIEILRGGRACAENRDTERQIPILLVNQTFRKARRRWDGSIDPALLVSHSEQTMNIMPQVPRTDVAARRMAKTVSISLCSKAEGERTMLKLVEGSYASFFPREVDAMFRNRAEIFSERLGWEVVVNNGYERDAFDDENPLYLVSVDPITEEYWGSLRLLPTTGPNMLRDVFPQLLDGDYIESATIWESSRICASAVSGQPERSRNGVNYVLSELILGIGEVAVAAGLTQIVSVFDARVFRVLKAAGCNPQLIGTPRRIGDVMCYAGLFDTGEDELAAFRAAAGIGRSVLAPGARDLAFA